MQYTEAQLVTMSGTELVALYNSLVEADKGVRRFSDHKTGVRRVLAALGNAAPKAESTPEKAEQPTKRATAAPAAPKPAPKVETAPAKGRVTAHAANPDGKAPRPDSKRGQLLAWLRDTGATVEEIMERFDWKRSDTADALRLLGTANGIATELGEDGKWHAEKAESPAATA